MGNAADADNIYISEGFDNFAEGGEKRFLHLPSTPRFTTSSQRSTSRWSFAEPRRPRATLCGSLSRQPRDNVVDSTAICYRVGQTVQGELLIARRGHFEVAQFVEFAKAAPFAGRQRIGLDEAALKALAFSKDTLMSLVLQHHDVIAEIMSQNVTKEDIAGLAHRRKVLSHFQRLLSDNAFFSSEAKIRGGGERVWQKFFEENHWIFGYGLLYTSLEAFRGKPLERPVAGHSISGRGKRVDALLRTRGEISAICFVEIKTHTTPLLGQEYRREAWPVSRELAGAVAQCQRTVQSALLDSETTRHDETNDIGDPTGESTTCIVLGLWLLPGS